MNLFCSKLALMPSVPWENQSLCNQVIFTQLVHVDHTQTKYSRSNPHTCTRPQSGCQAFLYNLSFRSATQAFHCSLQRGGMAGRLVFSSTQVLLVPVENGDSLPTHSCRSCVGKVERLEWYLKDLRSGLAQCRQVPHNVHAHKAFSNLLPFNGTEVNQMYAYGFYRPFTNVLAL